MLFFYAAFSLLFFIFHQKEKVFKLQYLPPSITSKFINALLFEIVFTNGMAGVTGCNKNFLQIDIVSSN